MLIQDVYTKYHIMPQLSLHMRRVAAVGELILNGWHDSIDQGLVMRTLLLHDMGNIVKFDLTDAGQAKMKSAELVDLPKWRKIQTTMWKHYGHDAHRATKEILLELNQTDVLTVLEAENKLYFSQASDAELAYESDATLILMYADCRVAPAGVVGFDKRLRDLSDRYGQQGSGWRNWMNHFEQYLQNKTKTQLDSITEILTAIHFEGFLTYEI